MPRPKKSVKQSTIRWTEKAWDNIKGRGEISKLVNKALEKMDVNPIETQIAINKCKRYMGVNPKNPDFIYCRDVDGKGKLCFPKIDCQTCKFCDEHSVILRSEQRLKKDIEKLEKEKEKIKADYQKWNDKLAELKEKAKDVNIAELKTKANYWQNNFVLSQKLLGEKEQEIHKFEEEKRLREEKEQFSKIQPQPQPKIEYKETITEVPKYVEKIVYVPMGICFYKDELVTIQDCEACTKKCALYGKLKTMLERTAT